MNIQCAVQLARMEENVFMTEQPTNVVVFLGLVGKA